MPKMKKNLVHGIKMLKNFQNKVGTFSNVHKFSFIHKCGAKVQPALLYMNSINGVPNPEFTLSKIRK